MVSEGGAGLESRDRLRADRPRCLVHFSEVVIHLFIPDMRDRYQLEQLWRQAEIIDVPIHVGAR